MPLCQLPQRAVIRLSGSDTRDFLQGQLTHDINLLAPDQPLYAALLSPQGKCLFDLFLHIDGDDVLLDADKSRLDQLIKRLTMFRLRKQVEITEEPDLHVWQAWGEDAESLAPDQSADPRLADAGKRFIGPTNRNKATSITDYHVWRLPLGLAEADELGEDLLWLETNARELNGVSFAKGCYTGQENTVRMHHRGKVRKRLVPFEGIEGTSDIMAGERIAGTLRGAAHGGRQMVLIRMQYLEEGQPLTQDGRPVQAIIPSWLGAELARTVN